MLQFGFHIEQSSLMGFTPRLVFAFFICIWPTIAIAGEPAAPTVTAPPDQAKANNVTADRQAQIQERDRLWGESQQLRDAGKLDDAIATAERMLAIEQSLLGSDHPDALASLAYLAELNERKEDFTAARKLREQVLDTTTKKFGPANWRVTDARLALEQTGVLGGLDGDQRKQLQDAEQLAIEIHQLYDAGRYPQAVEAAKKVVDIRRNILGYKLPIFAQSLNNLAYLDDTLGDYAQAELLYGQSLAIYKAALGENHPDYANSLNNLAALYRERGEYTKAEPLYQPSARDSSSDVGQKRSRLCRQPKQLGGAVSLLG